MARKFNPFNKAVDVSFIKTLKAKQVYHWKYRTMDDVQNRLPLSSRTFIIASGCTPRSVCA